MHLESASREVLIATIIGLKRQVQLQQQDIGSLKTQLQDAQYQIERVTTLLKELQKKTPGSTPLAIKPNVKKERSQKPRYQRAMNFSRRRDVPTHIVNHALSHCPDCGQELYAGWLASSRQVIDLPVAVATITEHRIYQHWCSHCRKKVTPNLDLSDTVLGNHRVSLRVMSGDC